MNKHKKKRKMHRNALHQLNKLLELIKNMKNDTKKLVAHGI